MKSLLLLCTILLPVIAFGNNKIAAFGYDSTYVLSIKQKFAIPENVINADYVGIWKKTYTWRSGNTVNYSIVSNFKAAFLINRTTGLITVANANKIKGKIYRRDTVINLIIRSTDSELYSEEDTCEIWVKKNKYCKFIDYNATSKGQGSRPEPYSNLADTKIEAGFAYFIKRGNKAHKQFYDIGGFTASEKNPTIIGAYSSGNNPVFDGTGLAAGIEAFEFKNAPLPPQYCRIYNIDVSNYPAIAFRISTKSRSFGIYNSNFYNNVNVDYKYDLGDIYFFGDANDTLINWHHELINLESTGSWGPIVKSDASGVTAYNIKSATANPITDKASNFRFAISYYSSLSHFWFKGGGRSLQVRYPFVKIIDGIITGSANAGMFLVTDEKYNGKPDFLQISNVLFRDNDYGILSYNNKINNTTIENCYFDSNKNDGIYFKNGGIDRTIRYCTFINNKSDGIQLDYHSQKSTNLLISQNLFVGNKGKAINASNRYCAENLKIVNNTIIGTLDLSGTVNSSVINNFYLFTRGNFESINNFVLDSASISQIFRDPIKYDFRLKPTSILTIKKNVEPAIATKGKDLEIGAFGYD